MQSLTAWPLLILCLAAAAGFDAPTRSRWFQLIRRSRWLVLVLTLTFLLSTPGEALLPGMPGSGEGALAALEQGGRFVMILAAVAWLLERCGREKLMLGLYCLSAPLRSIGYRPERAVARLTLVFEAIDRGERNTGWRSLLDDERTDLTRTLELDLPRLRASDLGVGALGALLILATILGAT